MRLVLDSNEYIFGLSEDLNRPASIQLMNQIPALLENVEDFILIVPNIIRVEVHRNLAPHRLPRFYRLIRRRNVLLRWTDNVPESLLKKYSRQMKEEDALIAAICEAEQVDCIISENRHFSEQLQTQVFLILTAEQFLYDFEMEEIGKKIQQVRQNRSSISQKP
jgi:hypothetical protein